MWQRGTWWRGLFVVVVGLMLGAVPGGPALAGERLDTAAVDRFVGEFARKAAYPGVAVAITKGDQVLHVAGYGEDSSGAPVTAATPMPVASVSKSFTALAVMRLVEAGRVGLDAPVRAYLPDFRVADPRGEKITVRQLLTHTSGITDGTLAEKSLPQPGSLAEAVVRAGQATLATEPGTRYAYTNTNYHLAARLVEVVSGEPFADHLRRHVLDPIGMRATSHVTLTPRDLPSTVAKGHVYAFGASVPTAEPERFVAGSDGLVSTAEDMAKWLVVHNSGGRTASGGRVLSEQGIATTRRADGDSTYAMGWDTGDGGRVRHGGIWFTYAAGQVLLPSGHGIAVLVNTGVALTHEGTTALEDGLATLVTGGTPDAGGGTRLIVDLVLAALTLVSLALGVRNLRRVGRWARRFGDRPRWRLALRLAPRLVPLGVLVALPAVTTLVAGGRDISHVQLAHYSPALVAWVAVAAVLNLGVGVARGVALVRLRGAVRPGARVPSPQLTAR
ncbi:D-aminopeptidase [Actinosynnema sp. ALI-1.44]